MRVSPVRMTSECIFEGQWELARHGIMIILVLGAEI